MKKLSNPINSDENKIRNTSLIKKLLKTAGKVALSLVSTAFVMEAAGALETKEAVQEVIGSEGAKEALNQALKAARGKPALSVAATITCIACVPVAGVAASPGLCIACGILIAKVIG